MTEIEKIDQIWNDDLLKRRGDAEFLINFLTGKCDQKKMADRTASYALNIDAKWGDGKTFFLERLAKNFDALGHKSVFLNAWNDDNSQDPFLSIVSTINDALSDPAKSKKENTPAKRKYLKAAGKIGIAAFTAVGSTAAKRYLGTSFTDIFEKGSAEEEIASSGVKDASKAIEKNLEEFMTSTMNEYLEEKTATKDFKESLESLISVSLDDEKYLIVIVDELDRCKPSYAVSLLERIKHLFMIENIIFIFGTNVEQLKHSINGAYGGGFDGQAYLRRFFDTTYKFKEPSVEGFVEYALTGIDQSKLTFPTETLSELLVSSVKHFDLSLRDFEDVMEIFGNVVASWPFEHKIESCLLMSLSNCFFDCQKIDLEYLANSISSWEAPGKNPIRNPLDIHHILEYRNWKIHEIVKLEIENYGDLNKARKTRHRDYAEVEYVSDIFLPEWNGMQIDKISSSVQSKLVEFVTQAGQLS